MWQRDEHLKRWGEQWKLVSALSCNLLFWEATWFRGRRMMLESEGQGLGAQSVTRQLCEIGKFTVFGSSSLHTHQAVILHFSGCGGIQRRGPFLTAM